MGVIKYLVSKFKTKNDTLENQRLLLSEDEKAFRTDLLEEIKLNREQVKKLMLEKDEWRNKNAELHSLNINLAGKVDLLTEELGKVNGN